MNSLPETWPIDLGDGYRAEWSGTALWIYCPKLQAGNVEWSFGAIRVPTQPEGDSTVFWKIEKEDPLTLSPSIMVRGLNDQPVEHFFIRDGKVVQA